MHGELRCTVEWGLDRLMLGGDVELVYDISSYISVKGIFLDLIQFILINRFS